MEERFGFAQLEKDGNGIAFQDGKRVLLLRGQVVAEGAWRESADPRDYFYHLRFLDDFPQITHWAFGDAWTGPIRIERPRRTDADTLEGLVYFGDEDDFGVYRIERAYDSPVRAVDVSEQRLPPPWVTAPLPRLFDVPLNLPLRLIVARAVTAALDDNWPYGQWHTVSSAVEREHVPQVLTQDVGATYGFRLKGIPTDLREALCVLQGLR